MFEKENNYTPICQIKKVENEVRKKLNKNNIPYFHKFIKKNDFCL